MISVNEIFTKARDHLRAIAGESVEIIKKSLDKIYFKLDDNNAVIKNVADKTEEAIKTQEKSILGALNDVKKAIETQEVAENISIKNPEAITGDLKLGLKDIIVTLKEEVKNFDKQVVVKNDLGQLATLFKSNKDKKDLVKEIDKVEKAIKNLTFPEIPDITDKLEELIKIVENNNNRKIEKLLFELNNKEERPYPVEMDVNLNPRLIDNNRIRTILPEDQVAKMSRILTDSNNSVGIINAINKINNQQRASNLEGNGKNSVGTTAIEITFTGTPESILISADDSNTGTLYIGKSDVASDGSNAIAFLTAGESLKMDYDDTTNALYIVANIVSQNYFAGCLK